jgi:hypothetical protein
MKKILFIAICCLMLCGCSKEFQVSELIPNTDIGIAHLKGTLKNISNTDCDKVQINVEFSSGTIKENGWIFVEAPEKTKTVSFNEILFGASDINNIENYKIKFKNIECFIKKDTN